MQDFQSVIEEYHPILYKIGRVYSDEFDFDDLYQEMLMAIWKSLKSFKGDSKLSTWLYRVSLNTALAYQRKKKRKKAPLADFELAENRAHENNGTEETEAQINDLYKAIQQLKKEDRSVILLHLEEKSYDEISEILGITKSNVGVKINRIKKKLFQLLNNE